MKPEIEYKLLKKYYPNGIHLSQGVYFDIDFNGDEFVLDFNNPNDTSYSKSAINGYVTEKLSEFYDVIGGDLKAKEVASKFILKNINNLYLSDKIKKEIKTKLKEVDDLSFKYHESTSVSWEYGNLIVEHIDFQLNERSDREGLLLFNNVNVLTAFKEGEETSVYTGIKLYKHEQMKDKYGESDDNYYEIDQIMNDYPLLCDSDWQVFSTHTIFENE